MLNDTIDNILGGIVLCFIFSFLNQFHLHTFIQNCISFLFLNLGILIWTLPVFAFL